MVKDLHHLTLRVRDVASSARFYESALDVAVERLSDRCRFKVGPTVIVLRGALPGTSEDDRFSELRIGLDHLSFHVPTASELEEVAERLREGGVDVGPVERDPHGGGLAVTFRDPDNIQLELYVPDV